MRKDLSKLLCEHERVGSSKSYKQYRRAKKFAPDLDPEDGSVGGKESMTHRYGYDTKEFGEHLSPLYGQVRKAVGRPYDKFYSELCEIFDKRSVINQHILTHLEQYLEKDLYEKDGELYVRNLHGFSNGDTPLSRSICEFYVDPRDGIIKKNKQREKYRQQRKERRAQEAKEKEKTYRFIDDKKVLAVIDELWFVIEIEEIPADTSVWDVYHKKHVSLARWGPKTYHARRRSASKKLLKQHGIK